MTNDELINAITNPYQEERILDQENILLNDTEYLAIKQKLRRGKTYIDFMYNGNNGSIYLGEFRYNHKIDVKYNNKYIIIYEWEYNHDNNNITITNVLGLYDKDANMFVVNNISELVNLFNNYSSDKLVCSNNKVKFDLHNIKRKKLYK